MISRSRSPWVEPRARERKAPVAGKLCEGSYPVDIATYRVIDPKGEVVDTKDIDSAEDAHAWFVDVAADNSELGWRMEVQADGEWSFFDDTEGAPD